MEKSRGTHKKQQTLSAQLFGLISINYTIETVNSMHFRKNTAREREEMVEEPWMVYHTEWYTFHHNRGLWKKYQPSFYAPAVECDFSGIHAI